MKRSSAVMIIVAALAILALATNITVTVGGLVTLEPGKDPATAAIKDCEVSYSHSPTGTPNFVRKEICCQSACRAYCAKDSLCQSVCTPRCTDN